MSCAYVDLQSAAAGSGDAPAAGRGAPAAGRGATLLAKLQGLQKKSSEQEQQQKAAGDAPPPMRALGRGGLLPTATTSGAPGQPSAPAPLGRAGLLAQLLKKQSTAPARCVQLSM